MITPVECWNGCGVEFPVEVSADRGSTEVIEGILVSCPQCGVQYTFTTDGDGEADLEPTGVTNEVAAQNITGKGSEDSTHY